MGRVFVGGGVQMPPETDEMFLTISLFATRSVRRIIAYGGFLPVISRCCSIMCQGALAAFGTSSFASLQVLLTPPLTALDAHSIASGAIIL